MLNNVRIAFFLALSVFIATSVVAQQPTASLTGVVTDPNGAVIAGATVTAINKATRFSRSTDTNSDGLYVISNLPVGMYEVRVEAKGFTTKVSQDVVALTVGQSVRLNAELSAAGITEVVDLTGEMPVVDTETPKADA